MNLTKAKQLAFNAWSTTLYNLRKKTKCKDYGFNETLDSIWDKLPKLSQEYWLERA